jgi:hypothetical protein
MTLPEEECAFFYAVLAQLEPAMREVFTERVAQILGALRDPGPGDCDARCARRWSGCGRRRRARSYGRPAAGVAVRRGSSGSASKQCSSTVHNRYIYFVAIL